MSTMFGTRIAGALFLVAAVFAAAPGSARTPASARVLGATVSAITCQPGFVYRCGPKGCFCVKA